MKILLSGGGTGGHINPAIAIANFIRGKNPEAEILFVGNAGGMESRLVPRAGYDISYICVSGLKRRITPENIKTAVRLVTSYYAAKKILKQFSPDIVIGTGGYVCLPVMLAAIDMKIPTLIHEQNVFPGLAVRMVASRADLTAVSFPETEQYFKKLPKRLMVTGNPIRPELFEGEDKKHTGEPKILWFGGSLGAEKLNETLIDLLEMDGQDYYGILAATGEAHYEKVMGEVKKRGIRLCENKKIVPYIYNMKEALSEADLAVTRAGAITISELCALAKPAILVPSPHVTNDHQTYNARAMEACGGAVVITEAELSGTVIADQIKTLVSGRNTLSKMRASAKAYSICDACERIWQWIEDTLEAK